MMHSRSITSSPCSAGVVLSACCLHLGEFTSKSRTFAIGAIERSLQLCLLHLVVLGGSFGVAVNLNHGPAQIGLGLLCDLGSTASAGPRDGLNN
jgi:hypothetical protein